MKFLTFTDTKKNKCAINLEYVEQIVFWDDGRIYCELANSSESSWYSLSPESLEAAKKDFYALID